MRNLSHRAARIRLMRIDDFWASLFGASLPPAPDLTASLCSYGREFATRFFQLRLTAYALRFATVAVIGSDWFLSSNKILPMQGTHRAGCPVRPPRLFGHDPREQAQNPNRFSRSNPIPTCPKLESAAFRNSKQFAAHSSRAQLG